MNYKYEFFPRSTNLYESKECVRQCGAAAVQVVRAAVRQCERGERQCVAVHTVVCAQCARQRAAGFLVVYGSEHGSVRLSCSAAVCRSVRQCAALCGSVAVCGSARGRVRQCVAVTATHCRTVHCALCTQQCVAVRSTYTYTKPLTIYISMPV
jgi:hypothetical protein